MTYPLDCHERPLLLWATSEETFREMIDTCERYELLYAIGLEAPEDLIDLRKPIRRKMAPDGLQPLSLRKWREIQILLHEEKLLNSDI